MRQDPMIVKMPTREEMEIIAKAQAKAAKERVFLHKVGVVLRAMGVGLVCASMIEVFYLQQKPVWFPWVWFGLGVLAITVTSVIIPHNRRFLILHATASEAFYGVLKTETGSSQRILYVDQGEAALTELEARYKKIAQVRKRFSFKK